MTQLVLVRHGETEWNRIGRVQGRTDIPLNDTGRAQARAAAARLADERWDAVASSSLARAAETAAIIADTLGLGPVQLHDALQERDYGDAEGLSSEGIRERFGGVLEARESREDTVARVLPALERLAAAHPGGTVLVVSHGGVIGSLVRSATRSVWPERGWAITNGSDHRFTLDDGELRMLSFAGRPWSDELLPAAPGPTAPGPARDAG